ncbi:hypothetical protein ACROYT_G004160 [Oculina patagonica]
MNPSSENRSIASAASCYNWKGEYQQESYIFTMAAIILTDAELSDDRFHKRTGDSGSDKEAQTADHLRKKKRNAESKMNSSSDNSSTLPHAVSLLEGSVSPRKLHLHSYGHHLKHADLSDDHFYKRTGDSGSDKEAQTSDHVQHFVGLFGDNRSGGRNCRSAEFYRW